MLIQSWTNTKIVDHGPILHQYWPTFLCYYGIDARRLEPHAERTSNNDNRADMLVYLIVNVINRY
jgi:hypothetical protein